MFNVRRSMFNVLRAKNNGFVRSPLCVALRTLNIERRTLNIEQKLPTALNNTGNLSPMGHAAKANAANSEAPHIAARSAAQLAAIFDARLELRIGVDSFGLGDFSCFGHDLALPLLSFLRFAFAKRHSQFAQQKARFFVSFGGRDQSHVHAARLDNCVHVNFGKNQLF